MHLIATLAEYVLHGGSWRPDRPGLWRRASDRGQAGPVSRHRARLGLVAPAHEATGPRQSWRLAMADNAGGMDRILRIVVGLVLVVLAATHTVGIWGWVGVVPLATGLVGRCPAYTLFGIKTCKSAKA